jgi:hypothetical protein
VALYCCCDWPLSFCLFEFEPRTKIATAKPGVRQPTHPNQISRSQNPPLSTRFAICGEFLHNFPRPGQGIFGIGSQYLPLAPPAASYFGDLCHSTPPPTNFTVAMDFVPGPFAVFRPDVAFKERWGLLKPYLHRYYYDEKLKLSQIIKIMKEQYGFDAM